jgi:high-affinity iron transporter
MLAAGVIAFREGLEAALIIGIVMGYLVKIGRARHIRLAWLGVVAALVLSVAIAVGINLMGAELEGPVEQIFEGTTMILAVLILTGMIFWMRVQARTLKSSLEREMGQAVASGQALAIFGVAFVAVLREGVETALFLAAAAFAGNAMGTLVGTVLGLCAAALVGWLIFASAVRLNLRLFFNVTSVMLLFFAAGLFGLAVHEFQEAGLLPMTVEQVWNLNAVINEDSAIGLVLKALFGYNGNPSLLEVLGYVAYWVLALVGVRWWVNRRTAQLNARPAA